MYSPTAVRFHTAFRATHHACRLRGIEIFPVTKQKGFALTRWELFDFFFDDAHHLRSFDLAFRAQKADAAVAATQHFQQIEAVVSVVAFEVRQIDHDAAANALTAEVVHRGVGQDALEQHRPFFRWPVDIALREPNHAVLHDIERGLIVAHHVGGALEGAALDRAQKGIEF